jgi:hypothetical protein
MEELNDSFDSSYTSISQQSFQDVNRRSVQFKNTPELIKEADDTIASGECLLFALAST